jgi:hypothetical protein
LGGSYPKRRRKQGLPEIINIKSGIGVNSGHLETSWAIWAIGRFGRFLGTNLPFLTFLSCLPGFFFILPFDIYVPFLPIYPIGIMQPSLPLTIFTEGWEGLNAAHQAWSWTRG